MSRGTTARGRALAWKLAPFVPCEEGAFPAAPDSDFTFLCLKIAKLARGYRQLLDRREHRDLTEDETTLLVKLGRTLQIRGRELPATAEGPMELVVLDGYGDEPSVWIRMPPALREHPRACEPDGDPEKGLFVPGS